MTHAYTRPALERHDVQRVQQQTRGQVLDFSEQDEMKNELASASLEWQWSSSLSSDAFPPTLLHDWILLTAILLFLAPAAWK